jgi:hypothetical protein
VKKYFVLGAARWNLSQISLYRDLVSCLRDRGYETFIDTSILYGESERVIPFVLSGQEGIVVNTKFGNAGADKIDNNVIYAQFKQSKKSLSNLKVNTYFMHSIDPNRLTNSAMQLLLTLKDDCEIREIGFSGDNNYLKNAIEMQFFDSFMFSFNPLDMNNMKYVQGPDPESFYIKRCFASGVLKHPRYKALRRQVAKLLREPWALKGHDYQSRLQVLNKSLDKQLQLQDFVRFGNSFFPGAKRVLGVSSVKHLNQVISNDGVLDKERKQELYENWSKFHDGSWGSIT